MGLAESIVGGLVTAVFAVFGYLAHYFVSSLRKEIASLREENRKQGEILFQQEVDLNEAFFHIRRLTGRGGGRRSVRLTKTWRKKEHGSCHRTLDSREASFASGIEEEDFR